jgi:CheY-like chemotaxis protein
MTDSAKKLSVYLIEDDPDDQVLLKLAFEVAPIPVELSFSSDCYQALNQLVSLAPGEEPDIIVSDYNTPLMNGEEFLDKLREEPRYANTPKIILSTAASPATIESCIAKGATRYIVKPFSFDGLVAVAKEIIELYKPD